MVRRKAKGRQTRDKLWAPAMRRTPLGMADLEDLLIHTFNVTATMSMGDAGASFACETVCVKLSFADSVRLRGCDVGKLLCPVDSSMVKTCIGSYFL